MEALKVFSKKYGNQTTEKLQKLLPDISQKVQSTQFVRHRQNKTSSNFMNSDELGPGTLRDQKDQSVYTPTKQYDDMNVRYKLMS